MVVEDRTEHFEGFSSLFTQLKTHFLCYLAHNNDTRWSGHYVTGLTHGESVIVVVTWRDNKIVTKEEIDCENYE